MSGAVTRMRARMIRQNTWRDRRKASCSARGWPATRPASVPIARAWLSTLIATKPADAMIAVMPNAPPARVSWRVSSVIDSSTDSTATAQSR